MEGGFVDIGDTSEYRNREEKKRLKGSVFTEIEGTTKYGGGCHK